MPRHTKAARRATRKIAAKTIRKEIRAGKPHRQAVAIGLSKARAQKRRRV